MKALVLGGTSLYGRRLVEKLLAEGHEITIFTRGNNKPLEDEFAAAGVKIIHGDRTKVAELATVLAAPADYYDVVLDNTAMNGEDVSPAVDLFKGKTGHYILCSSVAVYPDWNRAAPYREDEADLELVSTTPDEHTGVKKWIASYANGKRGAEKALIANAGDDLPYTILRPAVIEGPHDHTERTWYFAQRLQQGMPIILPRTDTFPLSQHVFVGDVANFAYTVMQAGPNNKAYNIAGDDAVELSDYLEIIHALLPDPEGASKEPLKIMPVEQGFVDTRMDGFPPFFDYSLCVDNSAAKADYGFSPTKMSDWLPVTIAWELEHCKTPEDAAAIYDAELSPFLAKKADEDAEAEAAATSGHDA